MFDLEANEHIQKAIDDRQMPKVEYTEIKMEDYSKFSLCPFGRKSEPPAAPKAPQPLPASPGGDWGWGAGRHPCTELAGLTMEVRSHTETLSFGGDVS